MKQKFLPTLAAAKKVGLFSMAAILAASIVQFAAPSQARAAACPSDEGKGAASTTVNIPADGSYRFWSRMMAPNANDNAYYIEVDGNICWTVGNNSAGQPANQWVWVDYIDGNPTQKLDLQLAAGSHRLRFIGKESDVKLDKVMFTADKNCVPTGLGDNCATTADTTAPTVSLTAPTANATVNGNVNMAANAADNSGGSGISKVEFYVDGALKVTDTTAPYSGAWNSVESANGSHVIMAKAYDKSNNSSNSSISVTSNNQTTTPPPTSTEDKQAPSVPGSVKATAAAANKVNVSWSASTDNKAVAGYRVQRNGVEVADLRGTATEYTDNSALPNTNYTYTVTAYDAANNVSAASSGATVKTPQTSTPDTQAPTTPTDVRVLSVEQKQVNIAWRASSDNVGVKSYEVYRKKGSGSSEKIATVSSTNFGDSGLTASTAYTYYVTAKDAASNTSPQSEGITATTKAESNSGNTGGNTGTIVGSVNIDFAGGKIIITVNGSKRIINIPKNGNYKIPNVPKGNYTIKYKVNGKEQTKTVKVDPGSTRTQNVTFQK